MIYRAKPGTHSYAWIKQTVEARHAAFACYLRRVEKAVGFELGPFVMRTPNSSFDGRFTIEQIGVTPERFDQLGRRVWKQTAVQADGTILVKPIRRTRQGRLIAQAMDSCADLPNFMQIHDALEEITRSEFEHIKEQYRQNETVHRNEDSAGRDYDDGRSL